MTNLDSVWKSRVIKKKKQTTHPLANKVSYSQSYGFSSNHGWMWKLCHKEVWAPKNWCFQIVALEKTLESPLDCKESKPVNSTLNIHWKCSHMFWETKSLRMTMQIVECSLLHQGAPRQSLLLAKDPNQFLWNLIYPKCTCSNPPPQILWN